MHRHDILRRQREIEVGEDRLLHLARIGRAADQHDLAGEIAGDHGLGAAAVTGRIGLEGRQVDDGEFGRETLELAALGTDQQVADEQGVPGIFGEDPGADPIGRIGTALKVLGEQFPALGMLQKILQQGVELRRRDGAVILPPDRILGGLVPHHELVLGRAPGMHAGLRQKRAALHQLGFATLERLLVEGRRLQVPVDFLEIPKADGLSALRAVEDADSVHWDFS